MSTLSELLQSFQSHVLTGDSGITQDILSQPGTLTVAERLGIYHNAYRLRLVEAVAQCYPALEKLVSKEKFAELANAYIEACPSHSPAIFDASKQLPMFLEKEFPDHPDWAELGRFELFYNLIHMTPHTPAITVSDLANLTDEDWSNLILVPHPSIHTCVFHYNAPLFWDAAQNNKEPPVINKYEKPVTFIFWCFDYYGYFLPLDEMQAWMIKAIKEGKTFSEICEGACQWLSEETVAQTVGGIIGEWIEQGIFSEFRIK